MKRECTAYYEPCTQIPASKKYRGWLCNNELHLSCRELDSCCVSFERDGEKYLDKLLRELDFYKGKTHNA